LRNRANVGSTVDTGVADLAGGDESESLAMFALRFVPLGVGSAPLAVVG